MCGGNCENCSRGITVNLSVGNATSRLPCKPSIDSCCKKGTLPTSSNSGCSVSQAAASDCPNLDIVFK